MHQTYKFRDPFDACPEEATSTRPVRIGTLPDALETTFKKYLAKL